MMGFDIDITIVTIFLMVTLIIGLSYGRGVTSITDYALGGRNFSTGTIIASIVATYFSGSSFFITISKTYSIGISYVIASSFMAVQLLLMAYFIIPKMHQYLGNISVSELMGNLYGEKVKLITGAAGIACSLGFIAAQFKACGYIFSYFLNLPGNIAVISVGIIVTIYSSFGGIRAVTFSNILQFAVFAIVIPMTGVFMWSQLQFSESFYLAEAFQEPKFNLAHLLNFQNLEFWQMIPLLLYFVIPGMEPVFMQRILMSRDIDQVKQAFLASAIILIILKLSIAWIPFIIFTVNPNLDSSDLLSYFVNNYTIIGLKGLVIIAVLAMAISTADAHINATSVLFANDTKDPEIDTKHELLLSRLVAFILGGMGILMALGTDDLLEIVLLTQNFYMPVVTVPLIMSIIGFRPAPKSIVNGMIAGFGAVIAWAAMEIEVNGIVAAMVVNFIVLTCSHYILPVNTSFQKDM